MRHVVDLLEFPLWNIANELKSSLDAFIGFAVRLNRNEIGNHPDELSDGKILRAMADRIIERWLVEK